LPSGPESPARGSVGLGPRQDRLTVVDGELAEAMAFWTAWPARSGLHPNFSIGCSMNCATEMDAPPFVIARSSLTTPFLGPKSPSVNAT